MVVVLLRPKGNMTEGHECSFNIPHFGVLYTADNTVPLKSTEEYCHTIVMVTYHVHMYLIHLVFFFILSVKSGFDCSMPLSVC